MSDDHLPENDTLSEDCRDSLIDRLVTGTHRMTQSLETVPPSKRFLIMSVGFLGVILIVMSVGFGIYSIFAPSRPKNDGMTLVEAFVGLDATLKANHAKIHAELSLIVDDGDSSTQLMNKDVPKENDLALLLRNEYRSVNWENELPTLRRFVSRKPWQIGFLEIKNIRPFLALCDAKRESVRAMLDNPDVDMQLAYQRDEFGFSVDKKDRDHLWGYVHLEEYELARALIGLTLQEIQSRDEPPEQAKPNLTQALDALQYILKAAEVASRQKELNLRFDAAYIRENALDMVQSLVRHPRFDLHDANRVRNMLEEQIANWPSDGPAFAGERTAAVWLYELARRGKLLDNLVQQDIASLQKLGSLVGIERLMIKKINADELFYLKRMSEIIAICGKDYCDRIAILERWEDELEVMRDDLEKYPVLAGAVLLRDVRTVMHHLAVDRARTEAWTLALATATQFCAGGNPLPCDHITTHPISGEPYRVRVATDPLAHNKSTVSLIWLDSEEPITVPGFALTP